MGFDSQGKCASFSFPGWEMVLGVSLGEKLRHGAIVSMSQLFARSWNSP